MKIIIAGGGKVGATLARQLSAEGYDLTLIDSSKSVLESCMEQYDVMAIQGNCATKNTLLDAGVKDADLLIATCGADEVNLLCCMTAHGLNDSLHTIARIRNPEYTDQIYEMKDVFALSLAVNPERQSALEIERLLKYPGFLKHDTFAKGRVEIVKLRVDAQSKLCNVSLIDLYGIIKCKVLVCVVVRAGVAIAPTGRFILQEGDSIFVTAPTNNLATLLRSLGVITKKVKRIMICGGGRVSYYLAEQLQKSGIQVQLIEKEHERCVQLASMLPATEIINGDSSDQMLLESEGLLECDALVTITDMDELNIIISLYGSGRGVPQVITKLSRAEKVHILDNLAIGSIVCPKDLCCNNIVRYVRAMQNQTGAAIAVHSIADGQAEAVEFIVDDQTMNCGVPLKEMKLKKNVLVVCITRHNRTEIPDGDSSFAVGDTVIIVTTGEEIVHQLNDIFA